MNHEPVTMFSLFPSPVYTTKRDSNLDSTEEKEIEDIIEEGIYGHYSNQNSNSSSKNSYIFDTRLYKLKEFIEEHIKIYVKEVLNPKEKLDFYITQSWLNVSIRKHSSYKHSHQNSIISGVFYVSTVEKDRIVFYDPCTNLKGRIGFESMEDNIWNTNAWSLNVENNILVLFPSWLEHNALIVGHRISIAFNVFARGKFGIKKSTNELIL